MNGLKGITEGEHKVLAAMQTYGGSFVKALAMALYQADGINFQKLKNAFPEYWKEYETFARKDTH